MGNFNFLAKICPNMDLGLETEKTSVGIGITILEILCVAIFSQMGNFYFFAQICPKMDLGSEIQKTNVVIRIRISTASTRYHVCQFSGKMKNLDFFGPNLPKNGFRDGNWEN